LEAQLRLLHKNEVNCAVVHPLNQSIPVQFTALLASPSAAHRTAHFIQSSTAVLRLLRGRRNLARAE